MVEHIKYDLFPTAIVRSKCPSITPQDKQEMMDCTDWMIEQGMYTDNDLTPKYQTWVMLFRDDAPPIWLKLRKEFYQACRILRSYLVYIIFMILVMELREEQSFVIQERQKHMELE